MSECKSFVDICVVEASHGLQPACVAFSFVVVRGEACTRVKSLILVGDVINSKIQCNFV